MVSDSYSKMKSDVAIQSMMMKNSDFGEDLGVMRRRQQQEASERESELARLRSGSAPPTVEGSLTAFGGLFGGGGSEEELRADPSYANYYYSNANLNPRLPPPLVSKEDWRFAQRLKGGIGDRRRLSGRDHDGGGNGGERSLFSVQPPGFDGNEDAAAVEGAAAGWGGGDRLIGLPAFGLGRRQRSMADLFQVRVIANSLTWCL